ncbi:hypothetical protein B0H19DRAFT_1245343 [Mycena capillaripes]|nr:hypothetical protein B0H19DRAFT_1245343 [Mycena capillaripes]
MLLSFPTTVFLASAVVAVSAQSGVFFSAPNCTGAELQTVDFTNDLVVPSDGAESAQFHSLSNPIFVTLYTDLAHQHPSSEVVLGPGVSDCVNIPGNIQSVEVTAFSGPLNASLHQFSIISNKRFRGRVMYPSLRFGTLKSLPANLGNSTHFLLASDFPSYRLWFQPIAFAAATGSVDELLRIKSFFCALEVTEFEPIVLLPFFYANIDPTRIPFETELDNLSLDAKNAVARALLSIFAGMDTPIIPPAAPAAFPADRLWSWFQFFYAYGDAGAAEILPRFCKRNSICRFTNK